MAPLIPILGARMAGVEANWISLIQLVPTVLLVLAVVLYLDIALSDVVPGAYDNASGVAAVLSAAATLDEDPPANLDVWVLLTGAEECHAEGMRSFIRAHRKELDRPSTLFINVDSVSAGTIHYQLSEGAIVSQAMDRRLVELCAAIADADREGKNRYQARTLRSSFHTDALPPTTFGFRAISISTLVDGVVPDWYHTIQDTPDRVDAEALSRATEFTVDLVRALDRDVARAAARK
jgi:Zn-dependent M28 family amino/carboxypeptidase